MGRDRAAYMRDYRTKRRQRTEAALALNVELDNEVAEGRRFATDYATLSNDQAKRITELEEEVRRLKRELAARPDPMDPYPDRPSIQATGYLPRANEIASAWANSKPAPKVRPRG